MKKLKFKWLMFISAIAIFFAACAPKDADIQKDVNNKLQQNANFAGITASVTGGVVTLNGNCETAGCDAAATDAVKPVKGVKEVKSNITVSLPQPAAPVEITADDPLKAAVNDAISTYNNVSASVSDGVVTLTGKIKRADLQPLMMKLNGLKPKKIENKLTIE